eukprot:CAMPEP_0116869562 /NCGR_PEP_ID=MMETSP0418-20121206/27827_1 /TAXON_ID=1158023 /ORGANISM="Astrosyne radiata, Strain 13vi08-1A" /LENGTH=370 /DNA_ID=CAMNT_0004505669 /DNA_START=73 /DNA_END=1185 /DNA_ORIENTATION=-
MMDITFVLNQELVDLLQELERAKIVLPTVEELNQKKDSLVEKRNKVVAEFKYAVAAELQEEIIVIDAQLEKEAKVASKRAVEKDKGIDEKERAAEKKEEPSIDPVEMLRIRPRDISEKVSSSSLHWTNEDSPDDAGDIPAPVADTSTASEKPTCLAKISIANNDDPEISTYPFSLVLQHGSVLSFTAPDRKAGIVCATNEAIFCQNGVDGALAAIAGKPLQVDIQSLPVLFQTDWGSIRCLTGDSKLLGPGEYGSLRVSYIIFAVGPPYYDASDQDLGRMDPYLRSAYRSSLEQAKNAKLEVVAFSLICCGNRGGGHFRRNLDIGFTTICEFGGYPELKEVHIFAYKREEAEALVKTAERYELRLMDLDR